MTVYNRHEAKRYEEFRKGDPDDANFLLRFIRGANFLDAGCGIGNDLQQIYTATGLRGYGCDVSKEMIAVARTRQCAQELKIADLDAFFPFDQTFDVIYGMDMIHHLRRPEIFIRNAFQHLNPKGTLIIGTESEYDLRNKLLTRYFPEILSHDLKRYHPIGRIIELLIKTKFPKVSIEHFDKVVGVTQELLNQFRNKAFSTLRLLDEKTFQKGLAQLETDFEQGRLQVRPKLYTYIVAEKN